MPRPKKKTALVEVIGHYLLGSDRTYQRILQDSMATDHGVIAKECTNKGRTLLINFDMKYIDAEKLKAHIQLLIKKDNYELFDVPELLSFIDSLQQEQQNGSVTDCHDLKEAAEKYGSDYPAYNDDQFIAENAFKAGAEWQKAKILKDNPVIMPVEDFQALIDSHAKRVEADYKEKMLKEAVEGYVNYYEDSGGILMAEAQVGCPYHNGDKVKIIIVKEEE